MIFHSYTSARSQEKCWKPRDFANVIELQKRKSWRTLFYSIITFSYACTLSLICFIRVYVKILILSQVLCVVPGNQHNPNRALRLRERVNFLINTELLCPLYRRHG